MEQKRDGFFGGPFLRVFTLFAPRGNNYFSKLFFVKVSHFITEHLEHIYFSLMLTLWCMEQNRGAPKETVPLGAHF